ncbi:MAG: response regulator [Actinobacteria bacterium]|nr:response regulator [Actinomycetota bacterium]MBU1943235.1 response regulator [Actinomycetota bacterium]MBU2685958.1 response regulator [Actinomycetota bacterium]
MSEEGIEMRPVEILLVEDSPTDIDLTREGLEMGKLANNLSVVENGDDALAFLRRQGDYSGAKRPDLVLLDLNLPGKDGREVLEEIKTDLDLMTIPVVVLTSSKAEEDIARSYKLHANCYITKPVNFSRFVEVVKGIEDFWFSIVKLPDPD